jgi:type I restriction enzyme S subunit
LHCDARKVDPALLTWLLQSSLGRLQIQAVISGASGLAKNIAQSDVKEFCLPLPPLPEQRTIANYLDRETARIDQIISKVEVAIERLQEYRSVLITAAVTGKIDVRRHAAQGLPTPAGSG